jgi:hypothetical protein
MSGETRLPLLAKLRMQIQDGFKRRDEKYLRATFDSHKTDKLITTSSLGADMTSTKEDKIGDLATKNNFVAKLSILFSFVDVI